MTESIDIMPTILDICGIQLPQRKSEDGESLLRVIDNPETAKDAVLTDGSIRTKDFKYIVMGNRLYNLREDPGENVNIAEQKQLLVNELEKRYEETMKPYRDRMERSIRDSPPEYSFYFSIPSGWRIQHARYPCRS